MPSLSQELARFGVDLQFGAVPEDVAAHAKILLLDTLGVALAGLDTPEGKTMLRAAAVFASAEGAGSIWGTRTQTNPAAAALINGTLAHAQDLDDFGGCDHSGAVVIPAVLAAAEGRQVTGKQILEAIIVGYDAALRVLEAAGGFHVHTSRGWHTTGTCGSFGAAAGVAKVLSLPLQQTVWALGLAGSYTGGTWAFHADNSMSKRYHVGRAAENGVVAGFLAQQGFTGPTQILEAEWGGFLPTLARADAQPTKISDGLGVDFKILRSGVKPYACCRDIHSTIDIILDLQRTENLRADLVEAVRVDCSPTAFKMVNNAAPDTRQAAQMSLPYSVAVALATGRASLDEYEDARRSDSRVHGLMGRVQLHVAEDVRDGTEPRVAVTTKDGRTFVKQVQFAKGAPENPLRKEEVIAKYDHLAARALTPDAVQKLKGLVFSIEQPGAVAELFSTLRESRS